MKILLKFIQLPGRATALRITILLNIKNYCMGGRNTTRGKTFSMNRDILFSKIAKAPGHKARQQRDNR